MSFAWDELAPADQDALDRAWRGVALPRADAARLVRARLAMLDRGDLRLTERGERLILARHAALLAERQQRRQLALSAW